MFVHTSASGIDTNRAARSEIRVTPLVGTEGRLWKPGQETMSNVSDSSVGWRETELTPCIVLG